MPKVSIIIPTYNVEQYLRECLDSVTGQTLRDIEIICVNDGSTDHSLDIIREYAAADPRIVVLTGPNGGYGKAVNKGFDAATGEYIGIVEPDDYVAETMYEDLYEIASENRLDLVKADFYRFRRDNESGDMELTLNRLSLNKEDYNKVFCPCREPGRLIYKMNTWSGIYRREFLLKAGIRHHETPGASFQDNGFQIQTFAFAERGMIVDTPYYRNRRDNPNSSVRNTGKVNAINAEYDWIRDVLMEHPATWERFKYDYWRQRFFNYTPTLKRIAPELRREYLEKVRRELLEAKADGLLKKDVFPRPAWHELNMILNNPEEYLRFMLLSDPEIEEIRISPEYRAGFFLTEPYHAAVRTFRNTRQLVKKTGPAALNCVKDGARRTKEMVQNKTGAPVRSVKDYAARFRDRTDYRAECKEAGQEIAEQCHRREQEMTGNIRAAME